MGITASASFPRLDAERMRQRLTPPSGPVRALIDTDAANEIDDQFAIAWALLSQDRLRIEAVTAAPFSFAHHRQGLLAAEARLDAQARGDAIDEQLAGGYQGWVERLHRTGRRAVDLEFCSPDEGMERSYQEILRVFDMVGIARGGRVVRGAASYLADLDAPRPSPATEAIVDLAKSGDPPQHRLAAESGLGADLSDLLAGPDRSAVLATCAGSPPDARGVRRAAGRHLHRSPRQDRPRAFVN